MVGVGGWNALVAAVKECESGVLAVKKWLVGGKLGTATKTRDHDDKQVSCHTRRFVSTPQAGKRQPLKEAFGRTLMPFDTIKF